MLNKQVTWLKSYVQVSHGDDEKENNRDKQRKKKTNWELQRKTVTQRLLHFGWNCHLHLEVLSFEVRGLQIRSNAWKSYDHLTAVFIMIRKCNFFSRDLLASNVHVSVVLEFKRWCWTKWRRSHRMLSCLPFFHLSSLSSTQSAHVPIHKLTVFSVVGLQSFTFTDWSPRYVLTLLCIVVPYIYMYLQSLPHRIDSLLWSFMFTCRAQRVMSRKHHCP